MTEQNDSTEKTSRIALELIELLSREHRMLVSEIERMKNIINEASVTLRQSFHEFNDQHNQLFDSLKQHIPLEEIEKNKLGQNELLGKGVMALQFEDIIQQMLGHASHRLDAIETLLNKLTSDISDIANSEDDMSCMEILTLCSNEIESTRKKLELESPVNQESLEKGDVTLF